MDRISDTQRLAALLRTRLEERSKAATRTSKAPSQGGGQAAPKTKSSGVRALAAVEGVEGRALRRAVIQDVLAERLGNGLVNDAQFQQVVARVTDAIDDDETASRLLTRLIADIAKG